MSPDPAARAAARIVVRNPSDGGFLFWLAKLYAFGFLCLLGLVAMAGAATYVHFALRVPPIPDLGTYAAHVPKVTQVRGWDGTPIAEWAVQRREVVPLEEIPPRLLAAFLAVEDRRFFEHGGIDLRGVVRALWANVRAGGIVQGGSTITQQVARSLFSDELFFERSLLRKIPEAIAARRIEQRYDKRAILAYYLNNVFLGHGAYGVAAAARRYFDKNLGELDAAEMATLAGIARAPTTFSPLSRPERTRARRDQVLTAMGEAGYLTAEERQRHIAAPLLVRSPPDMFREISPYFAEHVRRDIARRYGRALWQGGLEIETTLVPWIDVAAQENVDFSLRKLDKRQGWRGPLARLRGADLRAFRERAASRYGAAPLEEGRFYLALVEEVADKEVRLRVGRGLYRMPLSSFSWAFPFSKRDATNGRTIASAHGVLRRGDVVWVSRAQRSRVRRFSDWTYDEKNDARWIPASDQPTPMGADVVKLEQTPRVQSALFTYDHGSGYVLAMVGGLDFDRSEFNRVVQACRQPGSTYKPIYYSLALDRGYGFGSILNDLPRAEIDPITGEVWRPVNLGNTAEVQVTLERALTWSKNVPSVQLLKLVGIKDVVPWARALGFTTPIIADQALALGASCVHMSELTRAFSAFAGNGVVTSPVYVRRIRDYAGQVIEDNTAIGDPMGTPAQRLDRLVALAGSARKPAIPPRTAWLTSQLLRKVITRGHSGPMRAIEIPVAGKTGTSSATMDVWFVGYTSRWMTTAWIGDDLRERPLGVKDAAFMLAVPMTARYLHETSAGQPLEEIPSQTPPGVKLSDTGGTLRTTAAELDTDI
jgi:penicillin-binding protein 1A